MLGRRWTSKCPLRSPLNGLAEGDKGVLKTGIKIWARGIQSDQMEALSHCLFAHRAVLQTSTDLAPFCVNVQERPKKTHLGSY